MTDTTRGCEDRGPAGLDTWEAFRRQFPVADRYVYFNHAAVSPMPSDAAREVADWARRFSEEGIVCNRDYQQAAQQARERAGRLLNASSAEITFIKNTTQGILLAANGLDWRPGDNLVIPDREFPANVYPWLKLRDRGVEVRIVPLEDGRFTPADIAAYVDGRTRVVSVSAVSFTNGFRCDLEGIGRLCRERGVFFVVDGIQALGALDVDVKASHVDLLAADAHKWLLGPQGAGIAYIAESALEKLAVDNLGWNSMTDPGDYLNYTIRLKPDASRFEEGTPNAFGIVALGRCLALLLDIGMPLVDKRIMDLTDVLARGLRDRGYTLRSPMAAGERSGILTFVHPAYPTASVYEALFKADVVLAQRDGAIRISPHCYNDYSDVDRFLAALP